MGLFEWIPAKISELAGLAAQERAAEPEPLAIAVFSLTEEDESLNECALAAPSRHTLLHRLAWLRHTLPQRVRRRWTGSDSDVVLFGPNATPWLPAPRAPRWSLSLEETTTT